MKKSLVVLLIAVLAMGLVFAGEIADFTGYSDTVVKYDMDKESVALEENLELGGSFTFTLDSAAITGGAQGAETPYAVIGAAMQVEFPSFKLADNLPATEIPDYTKYSLADTHDVYKASWTSTTEIANGSTTKKSLFLGELSGYVTEAKIVGENWTLDLINGLRVGDYAADKVGDLGYWYLNSALVTATPYNFSNKNAYGYVYEAGKNVAQTTPYSLDNGFKATGITLDYAGYKFAVNGLFADKVTTTTNYASIAAETPVITVVDGLDVQVAASADILKKATAIGASASVDYTVDELTVNADVDAKFAKKSDFDAALAVKYGDYADADVYFASTAKSSNPYPTFKAFAKANYDFDNITGKYSPKYSSDKYHQFYGTNTDVVDYTNETQVGAFICNIGAGSGVYKMYNDRVIAGVNKDISNLFSFKAAGHFASLLNVEDVTKLDLSILAKNMIHKKDISKIWIDAETTYANLTVGVANVVKDTRVFAKVSTDLAKYLDFGFTKFQLTAGSDNIFKMKAGDQVAVYDQDDEFNGLYAAFDAEIADFTVAFTANHMLGVAEDTKDYDIAVTYTGVEGLTAKAYFGYEFTDKDMAVGLEASYAADLFTVTASAEFGKDHEDGNSLLAYARVESDKIVDGATLYVQYGALDELGDMATDIYNGKNNVLKAGCKIAF